MLFRPGELTMAVTASWALFRGDARAIAAFDMSASGFWRSFLAIVVLVPLFFLSCLSDRKLLLADTGIPPEQFPETLYWTTQYVTLGIDWLVLPAVLAVLARPLGLSAGYVPFVVLRNWTSILSALPFAALGLLHVLGLMSDQALLLLNLVLLSVVLHFRYRIVRLAFGTPVSVSIGLVVLDFLLSIMINALVVRA
ncbi:hypothetical protein [Pannonibacter tanglangensis]|nr:hypothetical protein [Pannonibacter sp. XCT-53]